MRIPLEAPAGLVGDDTRLAAEGRWADGSNVRFRLGRPQVIGGWESLTSTLLTRAADVALKERRPLVLMVRETPLHLGHLRTMTALAEMGAVIAPPLPAFYAKPASVAEMVDQSVGRGLSLAEDWAGGVAVGAAWGLSPVS